MVASPTDMDDLTSRQRRILEHIQETVRERGYPPTVREIGEAVGLHSSSSVHAQLENLRRKGLLRKDPAKPRAIEVAGVRPAGAVTVPLVGRIAAGAPVLAEQNVEDILPIPEALAGPGELFALRVHGDSMVGAGILDGDIAVVRRQDVAESGAIVAALVPGPAEEEATIKRLHRDGSRILLVPEHPAMEPLAMAQGGRVLGVVVAVLRKL